MRHTRPIAAFALSLALLTNGVHANQCSFELDADLTITPDRILIEGDHLGAVEITDDEALSVAGESVALGPDQRAAVSAYAAQLRAVVPTVVDTALEGAEVGISAASEVLSVFLGDDIPESIVAGLAEARSEVRSRVGGEDEVWFVHRGGISAGDGGVSALDEIEPIIERSVSERVGALLIAAGESLQSGDGTFDERMEAFDARMERLGEEIDQKVESRAAGIEAQAGVLCAEMEVLVAREKVLKARVPELGQLRVLDAG